MTRSCTICTHPQRAAIDRALLAGLPLRAVSSEWQVSKSAAERHKAEHLPALLVKAEEASQVARADDLLEQLRTLHARTLAILDEAEQSKKLGTAVLAIREARGNLELLARLTQQLDTRPTLNLLVAPEWLLVRATLLEALAPYPEMRALVAGRLTQLEAGRVAGE